VRRYFGYSNPSGINYPGFEFIYSSIKITKIRQDSFCASLSHAKYRSLECNGVQSLQINWNAKAGMKRVPG
jgi:hypothetical protein